MFWFLSLGHKWQKNDWKNNGSDLGLYEHILIKSNKVVQN